MNIMPYVVTLQSMIFMALLLIGQVLIADFTAIRKKHKAGFPIPADTDSFLFRASRTHANTNETITVFILLISAGILTQASPVWLNGLAVLYVTARTAHMLAYYANRKAARSLAFAISILALLAMSVTVGVPMMH